MTIKEQLDEEFNEFLSTSGLEGCTRDQLLLLRAAFNVGVQKAGLIALSQVTDAFKAIERRA